LERTWPPDPVPLAEDASLRDHLYPYRGKVDHLHDYDKILVERIVMGDPDLRGTVLRLPMVYGPRDYQHRLFPYLKRMDDGRPAIVLDENRARMRVTRGYVGDVAVASALAATDARASGRIYNVGEADPSSEAGWVRAIGEAAGWTGEILVVPHDQLPDTLRWGGDARQDLVVDTTRIRAELGYRESVPRTEALRATVVWERANPPTEVPPKMFDYAGEDAALASLRNTQHRRGGRPD
jgi:nucleoside-diphosphate-sugar epimerase